MIYTFIKQSVDFKEHSTPQHTTLHKPQANLLFKSRKFGIQSTLEYSIDPQVQPTAVTSRKIL